MLPKRTFGLPVGYTVPNPATITYSDSDITNLFYYFSCCLGDKAYAHVKKDIKGVKDCGYSDIQILTMGLDLLSTWYNPNKVGMTTFSLDAALALPNDSVNIYTVSGSGSVTPILDVATATSTSYAGLYSGFVSTLLSGWTLSYLDTNSFTLGAPKGYTGSLWMYIDENAGQFQQWFELVPNNPCNSLATVQKVVELMYKICGCTDCTALANLTADNLYVPLGQTFNKPSGQTLIINPIL